MLKKFEIPPATNKQENATDGVINENDKNHF